jgi:type II secretory pathway pseudopilin PulG
MILQKKSGQSLIEILVAIGVGVIMLVGAVTALTPAIKSLSDVSKTQGAASVSKELLDNLRIFTDANWHNIDTLSTSTKYFLNTATSTFTVATGTEGIIADGITSGLVGYWKLDEASGVNFQDYSGSQNPGAASGTTFVSVGYSGGARSFNGTSDLIDSGTKFANATSAITISAWVNPGSSQVQYADIFGNHENSFKGFVVQQNSTTTNQYYFGYGNGATWTFSGNFNLMPNIWQHLVISKDSQYCYVYVNGTEQNSARAACASSITPAATINFRMGQGYASGGRFFSGSLDDVRIYNRSLSASEASTLYRANIFTRSFQISDVYRDSNDSDKIIAGTSGSYDPSTKKITIEYGWPGSQLKSFSAYFTRYRNKSFVQTSWQSGPSSAYTTTTATWFTTSSNINYSTSTGIRIFGL